MDNIVKLYGLHHSGSHYLSWLLNHNFSNMVVLHSHTGWNHGKIIDKFIWDSTFWNSDPHFNGVREKHGELLKRERLNSGKPVTHYKDQIKHLYKNENLPLLILIKNPYSWLYSYNIRHTLSHRNLIDSCKIWSEINRNYFTHWWPKKHFIKYESLRDNTEIELDKISNFLEIERNEFKDIQHSAVELYSMKKVIPLRENMSYEVCKNEHIKKFNITDNEFDEIFETYIDKEVLNTYIGL